MRLNANSWIIRFANFFNKHWYDKINPGQTDSCEVISAVTSAFFNMLWQGFLVVGSILLAVFVGGLLIEMVNTIYHLASHWSTYNVEVNYFFDPVVAFGTLLILGMLGVVVLVVGASYLIAEAFVSHSARNTFKFIGRAIEAKAKKFCFPVEVYKEEKE